MIKELLYFREIGRAGVRHFVPTDDVAPSRQSLICAYHYVAHVIDVVFRKFSLVSQPLCRRVLEDQWVFPWTSRRVLLVLLP